MTPAQQETLDDAVRQRIDGGRRVTAIKAMSAIGISKDQANAAIDAADAAMFVDNAIRFNDVSPEVDAKIAAMQAEDPREVRAPMTKTPAQLLRSARRMAVQGSDESELVAFLKENGHWDDDAKKVAAEVAAEIAVARADFERDRRRGKAWAVVKIALGILLLSVSVLLSIDTGSLPTIGPLLSGIFAIGYGLSDLTKLDEVGFESRLNYIQR